MNRNPYITVLIPSYNHEAYLKETIMSVVNQTYGYENIQLIVTDDCSNDNSANILKDLSKKYDFKLILNKENKGLIYSLNKMISISKGQYIASIASDDIMFPDRIEKQLKILNKYPEIDILAGISVLIDEKGSILYKLKELPGDSLIPYSFEDLFLRLKPGYPAGSVIIKRSLYSLLGGYDPNYIINDYYFWLKAAYNSAKIVKTNTPYIYYRVHKKSLSSNVKLMERELFKILDIYKTHPKYATAVRTHKIINISKVLFNSKLKALGCIIKEPVLLLNRNFIRFLVMLVLPMFILKRKFPEDSIRYGTG